MKIKIDKEREIRIILNVLKIIGETLSSVIGMFIGVGLFYLLVNKVFQRSETNFFDIFIIGLLVPVFSVPGIYFVGRLVRHRGSFLWTILASIWFYTLAVLFAMIFLAPYFYATSDTHTGYDISFAIGCLASIIGSVIGFHLSREVKKVGRTISLILAGIFLAGLIFHTSLGIYVKTALRKEIQEIKRKGDPVSLDYFAEAAVPDGQNAAPIYKKIPRYLAIKPDESDMIRKLDELNTDFHSWTEKQKKDIPVILAKNSKAFELAHEAALKPYCNFNIDFSKFWEFEEIKISRDFCHLLSLKSAMDKENGKMEEAVERIYDGFAVSKASGKHKTIIGSLIENVGSGIMVDGLKRLLYNTDITEQQYQKLYDHLKKQGESVKADLLTGFLNERCRTIMLIEQPSKVPQSQGFMSHWPFVMTYRLPGIDYLKDKTKMIEIIKKPYWETKDLVVKFRKIKFRFRYDPAGTKLYAAQVFTALRMYKIKNGSYPASLKELVPGIIPELPKDTATGKDFVYRREKNGFIVYSLGENAKDDRGKSDDIAWKSDI